MEFSSPISVALLLATPPLLFLAVKLLGPARAANEPPYIEPTIPLVGHAIGLLQRKYDYYTDLGNKHKLPIFTIAIPGMPKNRVYIINSSDLVIALQKVPKKLSFWMVEAIFTVGMAGLPKHAADALQDNTLGTEDRPSLFMDGMMEFHKHLKPGEGLDQITRVSTESLAETIEKQFVGKGTPPSVELWTWLHQEMTTAITRGAYGPQNPYDDPEVVEAFSALENDAVGLISYPLPQVTAPAAYKGRAKMIEAFEKYHTSNGAERAAPYIKESGKMASQHGLTIQDKARLDAVGGHAILANTIPTAFWTLYHVLSDPAVLEEVREAVKPLVSSAEMGDGSWKHEIDISKIRDVPILKSVLYEALRHYGSGTGARIVVEDTMLDERYMLKKGAFIFMPNRLYHFNREAWGDDVDAFDAHRFTGKRQHHPGAFRGFGGGANLCPGRFFAMNEILACCAMLVLRFDVRPSRIGGPGERWTHPGADGSNMSLIVNPPKGQVYVDVVERAGWGPGTWSFKL